ncbi:MAG: hypothetical protein OEZ14_03370 [Acidimicrobiia bacterium]|nr:hypothetical protein [Acidimicrobiia bacterium]
MQQTIKGLGRHLLGTDQRSYEADIADLTAAGAAFDLAERIAGLSPSVAATAGTPGRRRTRPAAHARRMDRPSQDRRRP